MRLSAFLTVVLALGSRPEAWADDAHGTADPRFALSLKAGILHTDDETFEATWYRPATLEGSAWVLRSPRRWFDGIQLYGSLGIESASVDYRQRPSDYQEGLVGIHHADIQVARGPVYGFGARLSLYDDGRFRLTGFGDVAMQFGASEVGVDALLIDLQGLKVDVAKAVRENASVSYDGRVHRVGLTAAVSLRPARLRWTPYLTVGWMRYRADLGFETNDRLETALKSFGVDPAVLSDRAVIETDVFFAPGVRLDLSRAWSLEAQALLGRYDGTWVAAGALGAAWRFGD